MKLQVERTPRGTREARNIDEARTPYQRLLDSSFLKEETKQQLRARYRTLNPAQLKRQIEAPAKKTTGHGSQHNALSRKRQSAKGKRG